MTEPHHHVFNAVQKDILKGVKILAVLPYLVEKKVIPESQAEWYESQPKNGMKILISYLRNQSYETFLDFVECIFLAQRDSPAKVQSTVVGSMTAAVQDFDQRNSTTHAERIISIQQKYMKQVEEEATKVQVEPATEETETLKTPPLEAASGKHFLTMMQC